MVDWKNTRECKDGGHKEKIEETEFSVEHYVVTYQKSFLVIAYVSSTAFEDCCPRIVSSYT